MQAKTPFVVVYRSSQLSSPHKSYGVRLNISRSILLLVRRSEAVLSTLRQQRSQTDLCLDSRQLLDVVLTGVAAESSVHLFQSLSAGLGDEVPVEDDGQDEEGCKDQVCSVTGVTISCETC